MNDNISNAIAAVRKIKGGRLGHADCVGDYISDERFREIFEVAAPELGKVTERDSFSDGVLLALQVLNAAGDFASASYMELVKCVGQQSLIDRAKDEGMLELTGLDRWMEPQE